MADKEDKKKDGGKDSGKKGKEKKGFKLPKISKTWTLRVSLIILAMLFFYFLPVIFPEFKSLLDLGATVAPTATATLTPTVTPTAVQIPIASKGGPMMVQPIVGGIPLGYVLVGILALLVSVVCGLILFFAFRMGLSRVFVFAYHGALLLASTDIKFPIPRFSMPKRNRKLASRTTVLEPTITKVVAPPFDTSASHKPSLSVDRAVLATAKVTIRSQHTEKWWNNLMDSLEVYDVRERRRLFEVYKAAGYTFYKVQKAAPKKSTTPRPKSTQTSSPKATAVAPTPVGVPAGGSNGSGNTANAASKPAAVPAPASAPPAPKKPDFEETLEPETKIAMRDVAVEAATDALTSSCDISMAILRRHNAQAGLNDAELQQIFSFLKGRNLLKPKHNDFPTIVKNAMVEIGRKRPD